MSQYHIARDGQQIGVFEETEIQTGITTGRFLPADLHWTEGMAEWQPLGSRFDMPTAAIQAATFPQPEAFNPYAAPQSNIVSAAMLPKHTLASRGSRLGAAFIDGLVGIFAVGLPIIIGIVILDPSNSAKDNGVPASAIAAFVIAGLAFLALTIYNIVLLTTRGQTIAKKWLNIRIVTNPDGQNPGFVKSFLLRSFVNTIIGQIVPFYGIVDACFIFREDKRCLHDLIADTVVIEDNPSA